MATIATQGRDPGPSYDSQMAAAWRRPAAGIGAAAVLLCGCTYDTREPGLFRTREPTVEQSTERRDRVPPQPTDPDLPVAGERTWVSASSRLAVTVRIAVHAVRRIPGGTVLDWSITPVSAPGFGTGDSLPPVDFGLDPPSRRGPGLLLLVPGAERVYQPLVHRDRAEQFNHCLCTPLWVLSQDLRVGETRLLQAAFPSLPAGLAHVDVGLLTVAPVRHVPVTPEGAAPTATAPADLARPAEAPPPPVPVAVTFRNPGRSKQFQQIQVMRVAAAPDRTTLEWTLTSLDEQQSRVLTYGPPVAAVPPEGVEVVNFSPASGPVLRAGATRLRAQWSSSARSRRTAYECLCTEIGLWASGLRSAGVGAGLVTSYPALPAGTRTVDVELPGSGTIRRVPVVVAEDAAIRLGPPTTAETGRWAYETDDPPRGWPTAAWPTDTPDPEQLADYQSSVEPVVTLPAPG
jgi:hypothetical protein